MKNDEDTCRADWNRKIEDKTAYFEELEEKLREEKDDELEFNIKQKEAKLAEIRVQKTNEITTTTNTFQGRITKMTEERDACQGDLETCQDGYDTKINQVHIRVTEEINRITLERETVIKNLEIERTRRVTVVEAEEKAHIEELRAEWKASCTDKCVFAEKLKMNCWKRYI